MTTAASASAEPLDIGRVIQDLIAVLRRNFVPFFMLSAILTGIPAVILGIVRMSSARAVGAVGVGGIGQALLAGLVGLVTGLILQGALIHGTVSDMNGKRPTVPQSLSVGLNNFLPLFAVGLLAGLAIVIGVILLIVPGIMIAVAWCVAAPALVAERRDVMDTFGRSAELTRGNRWRIFGLFVIYGIAAAIFEAVISAIAGVAFFASPGASLAVMSVVIQPLLSIITSMVGATAAAVLYVELRRVREGVGPEAIAAVFD